jgi:hypothetical protein
MHSPLMLTCPCCDALTPDGCHMVPQQLCTAGCAGLLCAPSCSITADNAPVPHVSRLMNSGVTHAFKASLMYDCVLLSVQCRVCCQLPTQAQTPPHLTSGNCISLHAFRNCPAAVFEHAGLCFPHPILSMLSCAFLTQLNPAYSSLNALHQSLGSFYAVCAASWWDLPLT